MEVRELMTPAPKVCLRDTPLLDVAKLMVECDCGAIPVVQSLESMKPIGVITDRDIVCRAIAEGKNPLELTADSCMTSPAVTIGTRNDDEELTALFEDKRIRRVVVIDERGRTCGIVSQADLARRFPGEAREVVQRISEPTGSPSHVQ